MIVKIYSQDLPCQGPAIPRTHLLTLQALREALARLDIWLLMSPDLRALAWRASLMSGRLRAMLASLCPPQTPHITVCSSNVEEVGGDMGWEGKGEESREAFPFVRERPVFRIWSLLWSGERQQPGRPRRSPGMMQELPGGQGCQEEGCSCPRPICILEDR